MLDLVTGPAGPPFGQRVEDPYADLAGRAHDHRLAGGADVGLDQLAALLPVGDQVVGELRYAVGGAVDGVHRRGVLDGAAALGVVHALGEGVGLLVERVRVDALGQVDLDDTRLVEDADRGPVVDGALQVVDVDVLAEDGTSVGLGLRDRRTGEGEQGGVRQRVAQMAGVAVEAVVVRAVRLVDDHQDVAALGEEGVGLAGVLLLLAQAELLERGEDDPADVASRQLGRATPRGCRSGRAFASSRDSLSRKVS